MVMDEPMKSAEEYVQDVEIDEVELDPERSQPQLLPQETMLMGDELAKYHPPKRPFYEGFCSTPELNVRDVPGSWPSS